MAEVRLNDNGELVEVRTGRIVGKRENGRMVMYPPDQITEPETPMNALETPMAQERADIRETVKPTPAAKSGAPAVGLSDKSSFITKKSKYEVSKDSFFLVEFCLWENDGRFLVLKKGAVDESLGVENCWVKFRMWNYREELQWKAQCTEFNNSVKAQFINQEKLNEKKIKSLIMDWSFSEGDDRLKLLHTDGVLSDESYNIFMGLFPSIASAIVNMMNDVLENNQ